MISSRSGQFFVIFLAPINKVPLLNSILMAFAWEASTVCLISPTLLPSFVRLYQSYLDFIQQCS